MSLRRVDRGTGGQWGWTQQKLEYPNTNKPNKHRFDKLIYVGPPDFEGRKVVFKIHGSGIIGLAEDPELLGKLAAMTEGFTGAEIEGVCRTVTMELLFEEIEGTEEEGKTIYERFKDVVSAVNPITEDAEATREYEVFRKMRRG